MSPSHAETYTLSLHDALPIFEIRRGFIAARGLRVAGRPFVNDRSPVIVAAVFHPQRIENVFFQHLLVRFARDLLNDGAQEKIAGVAVDEFRAGLELEVFARILLNEVVNGERVAADILEESGY